MTEEDLVDLSRENSRVIAGWVRSRREATLFAGPHCPWPLDAAGLLEMIAQPGRVIRILCRPAHSPVAMGSILYTGGDSARLGRILVDPARRGEGQGRAIVEALVAEASRLKGVCEIRLGVYAHNVVARSLYGSLGFRMAAARSEPFQVEGEWWSPLEMTLQVG